MLGNYISSSNYHYTWCYYSRLTPLQLRNYNIGI